MSYTIKSLQKALTLLQDELQDIGHQTQTKNHIHDMYLQFQMLAEQVTEQQNKNFTRPQPLELE